jgi:hypothetical protein
MWYHLSPRVLRPPVVGLQDPQSRSAAVAKQEFIRKSMYTMNKYQNQMTENHTDDHELLPRLKLPST